MTTNLLKAHHEWLTRPDDERFVSLPDLYAATLAHRKASAAKVVSSRRLKVAPVAGDSQALVVLGPNGMPAIPTNWSFGQLAQRVKAPADYLRALPTPLAADCLNYGLASRDVEDLGVLLTSEPAEEGPHAAFLSAVTGPRYGRVWNSDILKSLMKHVGDGVSGSWRVPGIFGKRLAEVTKANTTLYASDRDMFVFLADEDRRIEVKDRRDGQPGMLSRGVFMWNSEVGAQTFGLATFLYDYVCGNRIVWGAREYRELRIRHTVSAPDRFIGEVVPAIEAYAQSSTRGLDAALKAARAKSLTGGLANEDAVREFLMTRFTKPQVGAIMAVHVVEEGRPIETLWDAVVGATAYAREIPFANERVEVERKAGAMLDLAA